MPDPSEYARRRNALVSQGKPVTVQGPRQIEPGRVTFRAPATGCEPTGWQGKEPRQSGPRSQTTRLARAALNLITAARAARAGYTVTTTRTATGYTIVSYRHRATWTSAAWHAWRQRRGGATTLVTRGSLPPDLQPSAPCLDCGWLTCRHDEPGEWYMVTDQVWEQAGMSDTRRWLSDHPGTPTGPTGGPGHYLCIGCLEDRLGRRLTPADFASIPINHLDWHRKTTRLAARLTGTEPAPASLARRRFPTPGNTATSAIAEGQDASGPAGPARAAGKRSFRRWPRRGEPK